MPGIWEEMYRIWKRQPLPEGLQIPTEKAPKERLKERYRLDRTLQETQEDSGTSDKEFGVVRT